MAVFGGQSVEVIVEIMR